MYMDIYMHVTTINKVRGHNFEREQGEAFGKVWGRKKERVGKLYNYNHKKIIKHDQIHISILYYHEETQKNMEHRAECKKQWLSVQTTVVTPLLCNQINRKYFIKSVFFVLKVR